MSSLILTSRENVYLICQSQALQFNSYLYKSNILANYYTPSLMRHSLSIIASGSYIILESKIL